MKEDMTHERCSELLLPHQRGELSGALTERVAEHLAGCPECSLEARGLGALLTGSLHVELDDLERRRLRTNIRAALSEEADPRPGEGWRRHAAPLLAAAALVVLVAVGLTVWPGARSTDLPAAGGDTTVESRERESLDGADAGRPAAKAAEDPAGAPQTESLEVRGREAPAADAAEGTTAGGAGGKPETATAAGTLAFGAAPVVIDRPYSTARFEPSSLRPARFPRIAASEAGYVQRLTNNAGDAAVAALIRRCTASINANGTGGWLPTLATYYRPDEILVIGFVRPVRASRILEYELRGWHRDCDHPAPIYRTGRLS